MQVQTKNELFRYGNTIQNFLDSNYKWLNATVIYQIDGQFSSDEILTIKSAMNSMNSNSCVRFKKRTNEVGYVSITSEPSGCWADTGRSLGVSQLNLGPGCFDNEGTVLHELMHTLGFLHQHTRPDRDQYVQVQYENIIQRPEILFNFEIIEPWTSLAFPLPYDYDSIMHYKPFMYSIDPQRLVTVASRNPTVTTIGQRDQLSTLDIISINFLYCV
ncbi:astacin-like metalloprotease toxin 2 isoform X2 [Aedes aegypti]|nr:astacin-like metalloprotease toxin 2 isoform X2 [Aedes aegypti]XP_021711723.1 astacin-like metalloprotease toxin 2 isoform X2 [Aedes aegypti]